MRELICGGVQENCSSHSAHTNGAQEGSIARSRLLKVKRARCLGFEIKRDAVSGLFLFLMKSST